MLNNEMLSIEIVVGAALLLLLAVVLFGLYIRRRRRNQSNVSLGWENSFEGLRYQEQALATHELNDTVDHMHLIRPANYPATVQSPEPRSINLQPPMPQPPMPQPPMPQSPKPLEIVPALPFEAVASAKVPEMNRVASVGVPEISQTDVHVSPLDDLTRPVPVAAIANEATAYLEYVGGGEHLPTQFSVRAGVPARFGRSERFCEHVLDDVRVSRLHASILYTDGDFYLEDEGSSGGTFINRRRLKVADKHLLYYGDLINFNEITYRFRVVN